VSAKTPRWEPVTRKLPRASAMWVGVSSVVLAGAAAARVSVLSGQARTDATADFVHMTALPCNTVHMGVMDLAEVLARHHTGLVAIDVISELNDALEEVPHPQAAPLTFAEMQLLTDHGGPQVHHILHRWDPEQERKQRGQAAVHTIQALIASTMSTAETAELLGRDRSSISRKMNDGTVHWIRVGNQRRIPRWQITQDGHLLPGLARVVAAIPSGVSALTVAAVMQQRQDDLDGQTPLGWLVAGGDAAAVAAHLAALARW